MSPVLFWVPCLICLHAPETTASLNVSEPVTYYYFFFLSCHAAWGSLNTPRKWRCGVLTAGPPWSPSHLFSLKQESIPSSSRKYLLNAESKESWFVCQLFFQIRTVSSKMYVYFTLRRRQSYKRFSLTISLWYGEVLYVFNPFCHVEC